MSRAHACQPRQRTPGRVGAIDAPGAALDGWRTPQVPRASKAANLGEWLNEPYRQAPVVAFLKSAEWPVLMREVADGCNIPVRYANRILLRLHAAGQATRHKLPIQRPGYCFKRKAVTPGSARRMLWAYSLVGG